MRSGWVVGVACLWIAACGDDGGGTTDTSAGDGATTMPTTTSPTTGAPTTADPDTGSGGGGSATTTGPSDSTGSATTDGSTSSPADSSGGATDSGGLCGPTPPQDACLQCVAPNCCQAWSACMADETCACVLDCHVIEGASLNMCMNNCNHDSTVYQELFFCGQQTCLGTCEWDCC